MNETSADYHTKKDFLLADICRATSAAPTYFPPHRHDFIDERGKNMPAIWIDGGVFCNNPSLAAVTEVLAYNSDPLYIKNKQNVSMADFRILSIGTGQQSESSKQTLIADKWGQISWAKPLVNLMLQANSQTVEDQMEQLFGQTNHLRVNVILEKYMGMDDTSPEAIKYWEERTAAELLNYPPVWQKIADFLK